MALKELDVSGSASRKTITLRVNGTLFISKGILSKLNAEESDAILIYIDDENPTIGIKFIDKFDSAKSNCKKLLRDKSGVSVNILPALRYYDIEKQDKKTNLSLQKEGDLLLLDISKLKSKE